MTTVVLYLGPFFAQWMECKILEEHMVKPPNNRPGLWLHGNGRSWSSIKEKLNEFCTTNSVKTVALLMLHIALRSKDTILPLLSNTDGSLQGMFELQCRSFMNKSHYS